MLDHVVFRPNTQEERGEGEEVFTVSVHGDLEKNERIRYKSTGKGMRSLTGGKSKRRRMSAVSIGT